MAGSVYKINKGIHQPIIFKGLKAQYIWYLAGGTGGLFLLFVMLYIMGVNSFACIGFVGTCGTMLFLWVYKLSNAYGEHGLKKKMASRRIPGVVKCYSRKLFIRYGTKL